MVMQGALEVALVGAGIAGLGASVLPHSGQAGPPPEAKSWNPPDALGAADKVIASLTEAERSQMLKKLMGGT